MESGIITSPTPMAVGVLAFFLLKEKIERDWPPASRWPLSA
ncbi:hypothetical protein P9D81_00265 [Bacillus haynesii]|nr:hypothetical protein [Bacillus haynesii]MEC1653318.1 hypothetical protein [Bacillus haynesii]